MFQNFILSQKLTALLGSFPEVLQIGDLLEHNAVVSNQSVVILLAFLSSKLILKENMELQKILSSLINFGWKLDFSLTGYLNNSFFSQEQLNFHKLLCSSCQAQERKYSRFSLLFPFILFLIEFSLSYNWLNEASLLSDMYSSGLDFKSVILLVDASKRFKAIKAWWQDMANQSQNSVGKASSHTLQGSLSSKCTTDFRRGASPLCSKLDEGVSRLPQDTVGMKKLLHSVIKLQRWWRFLHSQNSHWRGYLTRKASKAQVLYLRVRIQTSAANIDDKKRLMNKLLSALSELLSMKKVHNILHICETLDSATKYSDRCCEELVAAGAIHKLLTLIRSASRSIPDQQVSKHALSTLRHLARYPHMADELLKMSENRLEKKDGEGYNHLITLYARLGDKTEALRLWELEKEVCKRRINQDYLTVLQSLVKIDALKEAEDVLTE